jgi:hypothetical protein
MEYVEYTLYVIGLVIVTELFHPWCLVGIVMSVLGIIHWTESEGCCDE